MQRWTTIGSDHRDWILICCVLAVGYLAVFTMDAGGLKVDVLIDCVINILSVFILGALALRPIRRVLAWAERARQLLALVVFCLLFTVVWYAIVTSAHGWVDAGFEAGGTIVPFSGVAFRWQMFQGLVVALLVVMVARTGHDSEQAAKAATESNVDDEPPASALLLRSGDEMVRVTARELVAITTAGDQVELATATKTYLSRRTLKEFEELLPPEFLRIHRSTIINREHIVRLEPAGSGRLTAHMSDGHARQSSKQGAKLLREAAV